MNTPHSHHEVLDADERALARVVRALPGGEPPPALDARILKAAQDAVAAAPKRRRRPWAALGSAWGASSAAAAVLALGVGWQLLNQPRGLPGGDSAPEPVMQMAAKEQEQRTEVDFIQREAPPMPPAPAAEAVADVATVAMPRAPAPTAEKRSVAEAAPEPEPFLDEHVDLHAADDQPMPAAQAAMAAAAGASARDARSELGLGAMAKANAAATPAAPAPPPGITAVLGETQRQSREDAAIVDRVEVTGSRVAREQVRSRAIASSTAADRERVAIDAGLAADAWLKRIRQRIKDDDLSGAHASLSLYLERHPDAFAELPQDLRRLLQK